MSQHRPVPRLDLAPKLRRPLSLWNPLDYLRLLYWVFYFPQALRWYVDTFGGGYIPEKKMNWGKKWKWLHRNSIQRQLFLQGLVLILVIPLVLGVLFQGIGVPFNWWGVALGIALGIALDLVLCIAFGLVLGVASDVKLGVVLSVVLGIALGVALGVTSSIMLGMVSGGVWGVVLGVAFSNAFEPKFIVSSDAKSDIFFAFGIFALLGSLIYGLLGVLIGMLLGGWLNVVSNVVFGVVFGVVSVVTILHPENWLLGLPLAVLKPQHKYWWFPRITPLPIPYLSSQLMNWLRWDWETGLYNANQLLEYTLQITPVIRAVNRVLTEIPPEQVIHRVAQVTEAPYDWDIVRYVSGSLRLRTRLYSPARAAATGSRHIHEKNRSRAAATGFWHLHEKEPAQAMEAFAVVRSLLYGEEMFTLAQTLATFQEAKKPAAIAALQVPASAKEPLLRPVTWAAIASLRRVVEDVQLVQGSMSRSAKAFALNRALGELQDILDNGNTLPQAERSLIIDIAQAWQKALLPVAGEVGEISITKPVTNPYVVGDPVEGNLFVGREDVLRQLEELWVMGHQLQSVVLYGHRRMGKTSILRNVANCSGSQVKIGYINLLNMGATSQGVGEVLMAISDAISEAVGCTPPTDADLLNLPYRTFERYLKQVEAHLSGGLIVALDEFEKIEELIEAEKIPKDFMGYLRGLVQMSSKVAFAFAGLHTLEEMTADYFQPFFASVIPIHVGFLQPGATRQILANPDEDFPLDYTPEALDQIYALTAGQPYLVQLVGFQLVRRYNDYVFEQGRLRDPVFTVEDVEAVINDSEFFKRGRYYFDGVWGQTARGASGQQAILRSLAPHPQGLTLSELSTELDQFVGATPVPPLQEETLQEALKTLTRHDVIQEREGRWQIIVELFRRWVVQN